MAKYQKRDARAKKLLYDAELVLARLERLSADSIWAHRASGLRGSILKCLSSAKDPSANVDFDHLNVLVRKGEEILILAAKEIPE